MNNVTVLESNVEVLGKTFSIYGDFENPLFLAKDVAMWIDYDVKNAYRLYESVDETERMTCSTNIGGQIREVKMLTEDGLYEVLMQSTKPIAKQFKAEVKKLLKDLRTKKAIVVPVMEFPDTDDMLRIYAEKTLQLLADKKQLQIERDHAIATKNQINNTITATAMGKLGGTTKALNIAKKEVAALETKVVSLENTIEQLKTEPERTVLAFCQKYKIKATTKELSKHGKELTLLHRSKNVPMTTIPEGHYSVNVYDYEIMVEYFTELGYVIK